MGLIYINEDENVNLNKSIKKKYNIVQHLNIENILSVLYEYI